MTASDLAPEETTRVYAEGQPLSVVTHSCPVWVPPSGRHVHRVPEASQVEGAVTRCHCGRFLRAVRGIGGSTVWRPLRTGRALRLIRRYERR